MKNIESFCNKKWKTKRQWIRLYRNLPIILKLINKVPCLFLQLYNTTNWIGRTCIKESQLSHHIIEITIKSKDNQLKVAWILSLAQKYKTKLMNLKTKLIFNILLLKRQK